MKFGQMLVYCMTKFSNSLWINVGDSKLVPTSSRPTYDFIKTIYQDLAIFNGWYLPFLNLPYSPFQKKNHWNTDIIGYSVIGAGC